MRKARAPSRHVMEVLTLLGLEIATARRKRRMPAAELAERAGISRDTLHSVERGAPGVAIGTVFVARARDRLSLLPARVREPSPPVDWSHSAPS
jgi:DNA-binding XRE family transcriptional regulator